jgi:hypothetical protein
MLKVGAIGVEVIFLVAIAAYFITEGFGRNLVLDIFLALIGAISLLILVGAIRSGNRQSQQQDDVT